jgi:hypothetical protein
MTIGDYSRDDQVMTSSWVLSSFSGGIGVDYASLPRDQDRYYFGTLDPRYNRQLTLAPRVHKVTSVGPADVMIDFNTLLYYTVGTNIYRWNETTQTSSVVGPSLPAIATGIAVYFGKLFILTGAGLVQYVSATNAWTVFTNAPGVAMVGWDGKLFRLTQSNDIYWSIDPAATSTNENPTWEYGGFLPLPGGYARQLIIYYDLMQEPVIFAITRVGAWAYNFDAQSFIRTALTYPALQEAGDGASEWRGELRVPAGPEGYQFNNNVVSIVGPNRDDGLPESYRGNIEDFVPGHAFHYCTMTVPATGTEPAAGDFYGTMPLDISVTDDTAFLSPSANKGLVLVSPGSSWHVAHIDNDVGSRMGAALVADIQGTHRLWFTNGNGLFWIDAPVGLHNPLQSPTVDYQPSGFLDTFWFDAGWQELPKLALSLEIFAENVDNDNYMEFWIAWDEDDTWEPLGAVTSNGRTSINIGGTEGRLFLSCKLRITMHRGNDVFRTPVMRNGIFTFTRQPRKLWGWQATIRLSEEYHGRTVRDMYDELVAISESQSAGTLNFEDDSGIIREVRVLVSQVNSSIGTGTESRGQFVLSLIETDQQPYERTT